MNEGRQDHKQLLTISCLAQSISVDLVNDTSQKISIPRTGHCKY